MTRTQRISDLFDHLWPLKGTHLRWVMHETDVAVLSLMTPDRERVLAQVSFEPKRNHDYTPAKSGFSVRTSHPAFSGTFEQLEESAAVLTALGRVLRKMGESALIAGDPPA